jgi:hypothetical protein
MDIATIRIDAGKSEAGEWVGDIPGLPGVRLRVRGTRSFAYRQAIIDRRKALPRISFNRDGSLPVEIADRVAGEAMADGLLLGWDGITNGGEPLPYSRDTALMLLTDPAYEIFREGVLFAASVVGDAEAESKETTLGNSERPSDTGSAGPNTQNP